LAPATASVLGLPLMRAMRERYPDVRLHMVESLSGHLADMLNARLLDLAILFDMPLKTGQSAKASRHWSALNLLEEDLFLIDSLPMLMEAVDSGLGATLQPWAAVGRFADAASRFAMARITLPDVKRQNVLCSLSDDELSPAGLATRVVLADCARDLVAQGHWVGASLIHHGL
jgi:LysR family tcuABC transcriptional regulator